MLSIEVTDVCKNYGQFSLKEVNICLKKKQIVYLIGESGCGKSTILKMIAGLERPDSGSITIDGMVVFSKGKMVPPEKRGIGIIFQYPSLFPHKTVLENVMFAINDSEKINKRNFAIEKLKSVGMELFADYLPASISGGQQQLVTIARAMAQNPKAILLDEPFSNLDASLRKKIRYQTMEILQKNCIPALVVSHDPEEALEMGNNIYVMQCGKIIQEGQPYDIYYSPVNTYFAKFFGELDQIKGRYEDGILYSAWGEIKINDESLLPYLRPEAILVANEREGIKAKVINVRFFNRLVDIEVDETIYHMRFAIALLPKKGDIIYVTLDRKQVLFLAN